MSSVSAPETSSISLVVSRFEDDRPSTNAGLPGGADPNTASPDLCFVCRHLDFEHVGFHNSSEYSSNNYSFQREFPSLWSSSSTCTFCKKIVSIITHWIANYPGTSSLDVSKCHVAVNLETDWHTVARENEGGCTTVDEKAYSDRIRIHCSVPKLGTGGEAGQSQFLTFFLQKYDEHQPYAGRKRSAVADLSLFKGWKRMCQVEHGTKCSQIFKGIPKIRPRVVDVDQRCLVFAEEDEQWVCLSYVWGQAKTLRLTKDNLQAFSIPGSLGTGVLPDSIEDAVQVTKGLGEPYLWIDSLCIIQDDEQDKAAFISRMDSIYALAVVVIVSSTCVDANSCLPGVRSGSRRQEQEPFQIKDVTLVRSLDPVLGVKVDLRTGRAAGYLGETVWDTRAWTLQERFLASRALVFTADQVFWECEEAFWCEDSFREVSNLSPDPHRTSLCGGELNLSWNSDIPTFDHFYRVLLEEYSGRALTFDSDGLNAFSDIIRAFERSMGEEFFMGMPTAYLESALAWGHRTHKLRRRRGVQAPGLTPDTGSQFPSWSWVGWTSDGKTKLANQNLAAEGLGIRFYRVSDKGERTTELKQATRFNREVDLLAEGSNLTCRSSRPYQISIDHLPKDHSVNLSSMLGFWTASAVLSMVRWSGDGNATSDNQEMALSQRPGSKIQVLWSHIAPSLKPGDRVEIIAVAQNRGSWDSGHSDNGAIGVMVISWDAGGVIASREGFAWMAIREWTALRGRRWKLITLG
ncbi:hypothetical protein PABG_06955 [Paracoccidioides brasiliensis Pb03]|nr:hypothetical protein PABG_06955 [Paracoccidioides brasiliensis Pb03]